MPVLSTVGAASLRAFGAFGLKGSAASFIAATGGSVTTSGNYKYHTFTSSDTFSISAFPSGKYVDFLLVGGGGGGGVAANGTGGGGGGVVIKTSETLSVGSYSVVIGAGGDSNYVSGGDTEFAGCIALGGGYGGANTNAKSGGSGGGADTSQNPYSAGAGLQPTSSCGGYGNNGATSIYGGGGGGAGGAASNATGGAGISGSPLSSNLYGAGGNGSLGGVSPSANSGKGGSRADGGVIYNGADGIVIVRYLYQ